MNDNLINSWSISVPNRWLALERKFAFDRIDNLLLDDDGWIPSPTNPDVLKCAETFVTLLQSITARLNTHELCRLFWTDLSTPETQ